MDTPKEIGSLEKRTERFKAAKGRRDSWENLWRKAFNYAIPNKEVFTERTKGGQRNQQVYDETAVRSVPKFATRLQAALVPTWSQWAKLVPGGQLDEDNEIEIPPGFEDTLEGDAPDEILESYTGVVFDYIHHSNFSAQAFEAFQDMAISTAALLIEPDEEHVFKTTAIPLHTFYRDVQCDRTFWRCHETECAKITERFPDAELTPELERMITHKPSQKVKLIEGTIYDRERGEYHLIVMLEGKNKADIYYENLGVSSPWVVFGWDMTPGEIYHRGPVLEVLPAILSLNKMWEIYLQNCALKASGVWTGSNGDGSWNPTQVRIAPGTVIPVASNERANPSLQRLDVGGDLQYLDYGMKEKTRVIESVLFANPMGGVEDSPVRTLGENMLRVQDMLEQSGASFSLLERDFVAVSMQRIIHLLQEAGKVPVIAVDGEAVTLKMQSPLAQARDIESLGAVQQYLQFGAMFLPPEAQQVMYNSQEMLEYIQEKTGVPASFVNDEEGQKQAVAGLQAIANAAQGQQIE